ncbi:hypothetical protein ONS96_004289 [Cadophora gregata f. sp. sojae]|nr:hypothetical protein ONS96_004289 [Cadophora gregata f. sp. sojae]
MVVSFMPASRTLCAIRRSWSEFAKYVSIPKEQVENFKDEEVETRKSICASPRIWWCPLVVLGILNISWSIFLLTRAQNLPIVQSSPAATKEVVFTELQHLDGPHSKEDDLAWKDLGPKSNFFTLAQGSKRYGFEPGEMINDSNYTVSMFHELHCLVGIPISALHPHRKLKT